MEASKKYQGQDLQNLAKYIKDLKDVEYPDFCQEVKKLSIIIVSDFWEANKNYNQISNQLE